jgi:hypothetical protein
METSRQAGGRPAEVSFNFKGFYEDSCETEKGLLKFNGTPPGQVTRSQFF